MFGADAQQHAGELDGVLRRHFEPSVTPVVGNSDVVTTADSNRHHAVLSTPSAFQKFAFNQPNVAILHFPYTLLPAFIVPLVLFSHLAGIRYLYLHRFGHQAYQKRTVVHQ
jgi:hypothetical protein